MTKEEVRKAAEVMLAYADGKEIEVHDCVTGKWRECNNPEFIWESSDSYRIKPTPTYRPFANAEECWEEMKKHEPFGWVKDKNDGHYSAIRCVDYNEISFALAKDDGWYFGDAMEHYTFADGSVFGKLTEE